MFRQWGDHIDKSLETYLMATYEEDPFPYEWSEQDLYEQIRKLIIQYEDGMLDVNVPEPQERQRMRYNNLKENYLKLAIDDYMDYYNNDRYQWGLAKLSPNQYATYLKTGEYPINTKM